MSTGGAGGGGSTIGWIPLGATSAKGEGAGAGGGGLGTWVENIEGSVRPEDADPASWILGIRGINGLCFWVLVIIASACALPDAAGCEDGATWEACREDDITLEAIPDSATTDGVYPGAAAGAPVRGTNAG